MRHVYTTRAVILITLILLGASAAFGLAMT
ncbi:hypothetical protein BDB13_3860 [Rhodococcus sp. OK302]|nr:hypothetical protein BDB13_3860 [Rhodococcus sp. OK302]